VKAICIKETTNLKLFRIYEFRRINSNIHTLIFLGPYKKRIEFKNKNSIPKFKKVIMKASKFNKHFQIIEE